MPAILLTRPAPASLDFADTLRGVLGDVEIVISPLLRIDWLAPELPPGLPIFTSRNGVEGFLRAGGTAKGVCWCVGDASARAATQAGFSAHSADGDAAALARAIIASGAPGPFVHLRGAHTRGDLAGTLRAAGRQVAEAVVYDQDALPLSDAALALLKGETAVVVPLFSPRTADQFAVAHAGTAPLYVAAISDAVLSALGPLVVAQVAVAARPDARAMTETVQGLFDAALRLEGAGGGR